MADVPVVEVSHLAAASSFFSAVLQPLGLSYVRAAADGSVAFGANRDAVLEVRQSSKPRRLSSLVLSAPSRSAVVRFHECALRANPALLSQPSPALLLDGDEDGVVRAAVLDLDGNRIEAVYPDAEAESRRRRHHGLVGKTRSTSDEAGRVLACKYDDVASPALAHAADAAQAPRPRPRGVSVNASTVVGALLGLAAGAALTYGYDMVSRGREAPVDDVVAAGPRTPPRGPRSLAKEDGIAAAAALDDGGHRRDPPEWPPECPPEWLPQRIPPRCRVQSGPCVARPIARSSRRGLSRPDARARSRSEAPPERVAADLMADEGCSLTGPRAARGGYEAGPSTYISAPTHAPSTAPGRPPSRAPRPVPVPEHEAAYRSRHSEVRSCASARQVPLPASQTPSHVSSGHRQMPLAASRPPSQVSSVRHKQTPTPSHASARHVPLPASRAPSCTSARDMALPASGVGSSHAKWDDDLDSVAPDDSISCVGSRAGSSRRSRRHHY